APAGRRRGGAGVRAPAGRGRGPPPGGTERRPPPIVQAVYPDPEEGQPLLHRSIFECLKAQDPQGRYTATLLENWRMSRTLCLYPAEQIYTRDFHCATEDIATRRLALAKPSAEDEPADALLD